jgi:hypothetical protein
MAKKKKTKGIDWTDRFEHAGETYVVEGRKLDFSGERAISGIMKTASPDDYWRAELALIGNTCESIEVDGVLKWKAGDASHRLPSTDDLETGESTGTVLLSRIVTLYEQNAADKWAAAFEEYYDEDLLKDNPLGAANDPKPTPLRSAPTKSGEGEET